AVRPTPTGFGALILLSVGVPGELTVRVALAVALEPLLVVVTWLVVLTFAPTVVEVTFTLTWQLAPAPTPVPPVSVRTVSPATLPEVIEPPHVLVRPVGLSTTMPAGKPSVKAMPVSDTVFDAGLLMVMRSTVVLPAVIG